MGALVRIVLPGRRGVDLYVREIQDGRVVLRRSMRGHRGGWWLPFGSVLSHGELLSPGEAGLRVGDRMPEVKRAL